MVHALDLMNYFHEDKFPTSVVAHGGVYAWQDGRENPDTFQALLEYPKGFLLSYSTSFGNDSDSFSRIMGKKATLTMRAGKAARAGCWWKKRAITKTIPSSSGRSATSRCPAATNLVPVFIGDEDLSHQSNWFSCIRSRQQPNTTVHDGFASRGRRDHGRARTAGRQEALLASQDRRDRGTSGESLTNARWPRHSLADRLDSVFLDRDQLHQPADAVECSRP